MAKNKFFAQSLDGQLKMEDYTAKLFKKDLKENNGARYVVERITAESKKQRGFFEGAVVKLFCYFHERLDYHDWRDIRIARDWLMIEFNGEFIEYKGKVNKVAKSSAGKLNDGLVDKIIDYIEEQNGVDRRIVLDPEDYKHWRDTIFPYGGPSCYIDYLIDLRKLPPKFI
jgi:hypothetical protein